MSVYDKILCYFGYQNQLLKLAEESAEVAQASIKVVLGLCSEDKLCEEIADIEILLKQIKSRIDTNKIEKWKEYKLKRTIERINLGAYNNGKANNE